MRALPLRLGFFFLLYIINFWLFLVFQSSFFLVLGCILTVFPPLSLLMAWKLADRVEGKITVPQEIIRRGEQTEVIFSVGNDSWLCAMRGIWHVRVGNSFYGTFDGQKFLTPIPPNGKKRLNIPIMLEDLGRIAFVCEEFVIMDLLGIFAVHSDCQMECEFFVLPQVREKETELPDAYSGGADFSESRRKGHDYAEVSDIRTYVPGDRPRDIHWKLSARQEELMVKERVALSGSEHILLIRFADDKERTERLLTEGCGKIAGLFNRQMTVRLLAWNQESFGFEEYSCLCREELEAALCGIFRTGLSSRASELLGQYMKNCYPQLGSYLCLAEEDGAVRLEICAND